MTISRSVIMPALLTVTFALGGCSLRATPEPDPTLVSLLRSATADGRTEDATAIENEIYRLCGKLDDGTTPESCRDPLTSQEGVATPSTNPAQFILDSVATVPQESMGVVVPLFTNLAATGHAIPPIHPADLSEATNTEASKEDLRKDAEFATKALEHELAAKYGLGVAVSFADQPTRERIQAMIDTRQHRIEALESTLSSSEAFQTAELNDVQAPPAGDAAYSLEQYTQPTNQATAEVFLRELATDDLTFWENAAASATTASWRYQSLVTAGNAAKTAEAVR